MPISVLGVDLSSKEWSSNGTAVLSFEDGAWGAVNVAPVTWPSAAISPLALAGAIDDFAMQQGISAISLDGPQAWRDPAAAIDKQGHGRACEKGARTPAKTGPKGIVKPSTQVGWVTFAIAVFDSLLARRHVRLANNPAGLASPPEQGTYYVLECFPTSTWKASGLTPLPGKRRRPGLARYVDSLCALYGLPRSAALTSHDDLQAIVAGLPAAALLGAPARAIAHGRPAWRIDDDWIEGLIWDAQPRALGGDEDWACDQTST
jgi:hypothetical protein